VLRGAAPPAYLRELDAAGVIRLLFRHTPMPSVTRE